MTRLHITGVILSAALLPNLAGAKMVPFDGSSVRPEPGTVRLTAATPAPTKPAPAAEPSELAINDATEVLVDGKDTDLKKVPEGATVVRVEVGPDRKTILKIEFSTKK